MEIGVGRGQGALLALQSYPVEHIIGIDREPMQIERMRREQGDLVACARLEGRVGSAEHLPVDSAAFDAIYSVEALQHFEDRQAFVREAGRALRPGGRLALTTFFLTHDTCLDQVRSQLPTVDRGITRLSTTAELEGYLKEGPFEDVRTYSIGAHVFPGFDRWLACIGKDAGEADSWGRNWLRCFQAGLIDYCVVVATRSETYA